MIAANAYRIRFATGADADTLRLLAERESQQPLVGRVLIGQIDGTPAAALSLSEGRVIADPSRDTDRLLSTLRMRADAIHAFEATPSLRERLLAALPTERGGSNVVPMPVSRRRGYDERAPMRASGR
jgi:hypothetical protein